MEEELLKRNTDCVYFLASPLTCKKGSECEYRHSEIARLNPRDCWYWMSGTCLNPSCAFRHPPLDVQTETQTQAQTQTVSESVTVGVGVNKTNAPCYFFHNGFCNKGEKCSYMHNVWKPSNIIQAEKKSDTSSIVKKENKTVPENKHNNGSTVPGFDVLVDNNNNNNNNNVSEGEYEDVNVLYEDNNDKGRSVLDRIVVPRKRNGEDSSLDLRDLLKRRRTVDEYGPGPGPRPRPRPFDRSRLREKGEGDSSEKQDFERPKTLREILEEKKRMGNNEGN